MPDRADEFIASQKGGDQGTEQQVTNPDASASTETEVVDPAAQKSAPDTSVENEETPVGQDTETQVEQTEETAPGEGEETEKTEDNVAPEDQELDDATLGTLWDAYGDKFMEQESFKERVAKEVSEQVQDQVRTQTRTQQGQTEAQRVIEDGKQAVDGLTTFAENAVTQLQKASKEEEFSADSIKPEAFRQDLFKYGQAIVAEVGSRYDGAIQTSIEDNLKKFPPLSESQQQEFFKIVETAQRMELDTSQAPQSKAYFISAVTAFLVDRALETGATKGQEQTVKRTEAKRKVADQAAVKKAAAKLTKDRGNLPPKGTAATPEARAPGGAYSSEHYRGLKKAGKHEEAQAYVDTYGRGQAVVAS